MQPGVCDIPKNSIAPQAGEVVGVVLGFDDVLVHVMPPQHADEAAWAAGSQIIGTVVGAGFGDGAVVGAAVGAGVVFGASHVRPTPGSAEFPQGPGLPGAVLG